MGIGESCSQQVLWNSSPMTKDPCWRGQSGADAAFNRTIEEFDLVIFQNQSISCVGRSVWDPAPLSRDEELLYNFIYPAFGGLRGEEKKSFIVEQIDQRQW